MKVGVVIWSKTGNTMLVAKKTARALEKKGHEVSFREIKVRGETAPNQPVDFEHIPDISGFDAYIVAGQVHAFSLSPPMTDFIRLHANFEGKKAAFLITQQFPFAWMGGTRAMGQMVEYCKAKGARPVGGAVVNWMGEERRKGKISEAVRVLADKFDGDE